MWELEGARAASQIHWFSPERLLHLQFKKERVEDQVVTLQQYLEVNPAVAVRGPFLQTKMEKRSQVRKDCSSRLNLTMTIVLAVKTMTVKGPQLSQNQKRNQFRLIKPQEKENLPNQSQKATSVRYAKTGRSGEQTNWPDT